MKNYYFFCAVTFFVFTTNIVTAQNHFEYYKTLLKLESDSLLGLEKTVDSIIKICQKDENHLDEIKIAHNFSIELYKKGFRSKAIEYAQHEIAVYRKFDLKNVEYANALYNLAFFSAKIKDIDTSITCYKEITSLNVDKYSTARAFCELGKYYGQNGDFYKSENYYVQGFSILEELDRKKILIQKYLDFAAVLDRVEEKESFRRKKQILDKASNLIGKKPSYQLLKLYKRLNNSYANYYNSKSEFVKAKDYYDKNLQEGLKYSDSSTICTSCINMGDLYVDLQDVSKKDSAFFYLNKGVKYCKKKSNIAIAHHQFSKFYLYKNRYTKALNSIQQSLNIATNLDHTINSLLTLDDLRSSDNKYNVLLALVHKVSILIKRYEKENNSEDIELALDNLLVADQLVDVLVDVSEEEGSKLYWRKEASEIYLKGILVCEILQSKEKAFYFAEKKKALLLTEDIITNVNKSELPDTILKLENDLKKQILDLENLISSSKNNDSIAQLESTRFKLKQQYQKQEDSLKILFPVYFTNKEATDIVELKKVRETLDEDSVIISYITNRDEYYDSFSVIYATLISKRQSEIIKIGDLGELEELVKAYRSQLSKPFETEQDRTAYVETASELYRLLIPKDKISMSLDQKHLVIIPDGTLQYIPFESLIVDKNTNRYLIEDNEVSYAYSMSFLEHNATVKRASSQDLVSFAPINFTHDDLEDISNSSNEIVGITKSILGDRYSEEEASKQNFLSNTEDYKIIHLATHANFSDNLQIAFHDTNLEYHELYTSRNQAELVVLSACNTSLGEIAEGEGVMSLARGFFYAGANTVVSSLWNANDKSTAQIMESFYDNLEKGQTKSKALHHAKINYLKSASLSDASPHYWATFVLIGDSETELFPLNTLLFGILLSVLVILVIGALIYFLKKR